MAESSSDHYREPLGIPSSRASKRLPERGSSVYPPGDGEDGLEDSDVDEEEIEELEQEVNEMARKIRRFRTRLPGLYKEALESSILASRPALPLVESVDGEIAAGRDSGGEHAESSTGQSVEERSPVAEKIQLIKQKISNNVSAIPIVLKSVNECIMEINKLDQYNVTNIHPSFKRKRT
ncbi:hypothetical protein H6P81_017122 [Aristolochia fimbriata]|uniref:Uncharacterized protein n=1 Tax=Aristolochia fimbriata TaxID=158543 RepID=A0AAV7DYB7_ARIFI|nr:hypothetical protein H6P81_017122 [Aristolochia fimbriata]